MDRTPFGYAKAMERALELRLYGLPYTSIAKVMRFYHGYDRTPEYWRLHCINNGVPVREGRPGQMRGLRVGGSHSRRRVG